MESAALILGLAGLALPTLINIVGLGSEDKREGKAGE